MDVTDITDAMARRAVGVRELARRTHYSHGYLSRVLRGQQPASDGLLRALAGALGLTDEDERLAYVLTHPQRLDAASVGALADVLAAQRRADDVVGHAPLLGPAEANVAAWTALLRDCPSAHRQALGSVVAESVQFSGWLHAQAGDTRRAVARYRRSRLMAREAGDGAIEAQANSFLAYMPRRAGRWDQAYELHWAAHTGDAAPCQRVVSGTWAVTCLVGMGQRSRAVELLADVERLREHTEANPVPSTAYWTTPGWTLTAVGQAHRALGDRRRAAEYLRAGLDALPAGFRHAPWTADKWRALELMES